ncbi:MAG: type II toxin-antitoxin system Phd/YefM family antitoxin [Desulfobacteraceae bacterium]|nr:MAG: type II toxin-antitoxin system Phd/YefM family antitoxin [Desulfobacteraceae bacterium]
MTTLNTTEASAMLCNLIDETAETHQPIVITGKRRNAILLSEEDWNAVNATLYLLSVPGMRESIREGIKQELDECSQEPEW